MGLLALFQRGFAVGDMHGQKTAVGGVGIVFGAVAVKHHVALAKHGAVAFDQFAFEDQELFVAVVAVAARRHACGHAVDVEAFAQGLVVIQLQDGVAQGHAIGVDEGCEFGLVRYWRCGGLRGRWVSW